jgi:leader peptidase (prepilin peptidase)/N-methyltransferase
VIWVGLTATTAVALLVRVGADPILFADLLVLALLGPALGLIDLELLRLPDPIVLPGSATLALTLAATALAGNQPQRLARAFEAGLAVTLLFGGLALLQPDALGLGDVKVQGFLLSPLLAWGSWRELTVGLILTLSSAALPGLWRLVGRRPGGVFALGPYLFAGATLTVLLYGPLG